MLERHAKGKKGVHLLACVEWRRFITPLVCSLDRMAVKEARTFKKRIASLLVVKWNHHYSKMVGFVYARMALAVVRGVTLKLQGSRCRKA